MKRITKQIFVLLIFTAGITNATFTDSPQKEKQSEKKEKKKEKKKTKTKTYKPPKTNN